MLFDPNSELAGVFSESGERWLPGISNTDLRLLIYLILNWKERVDHPPLGFKELLDKELSKKSSDNSKKRSDARTDRLRDLIKAHDSLSEKKLFHPFMSDVVGNTICADILDYLARDRMNLGMDYRQHTRLQRYFTIRPGTLHPKEGLRLSILVTRRGHGGQRRDVATAVLEVMRERYEMAERVYYHHKKAAASAMLAKMLEMVPENRRPRDDEQVYPAPWRDDDVEPDQRLPHMVHLSDAQLIQYLAAEDCQSDQKVLKRRIAKALSYRRVGKRVGMYRTLLVVDMDLVRASKFALSVFTEKLRGKDDAPSADGRLGLEKLLSDSARARMGEVIVYCPSEKMQSKEIDVRLEVKEDTVLPLRELAARDEFVDSSDVNALSKHYAQLWRTYIFVAPEVFASPDKCEAVVRAFCEEFAIPWKDAIKKVRTHRFTDTTEQAIIAPIAASDSVPIDKTESSKTHNGRQSPEAWSYDEKLLESRQNLVKVARRQGLLPAVIDEHWNKHLQALVGRDERAREREGSLSEKDWEQRIADERQRDLLNEDK